MKKFLLIIPTVLCFLSCEKGETYFLRSYVMYYNDMEKITLKRYSEVGIDVYAEYGNSLGNFKSTGELKESYDALCEKHNDMTYNRKITILMSYGNWTESLGVDFVSIDMVSDSDFDATHSAGSSLGDIVKFHSDSLKPYIDSGYKECNNTYYGFGCYQSFDGFLSELTVNELTLMRNGGYIGSLKLETKPTLSKTHTFTVTMTADDGRVFTASIDMEFE